MRGWRYYMIGKPKYKINIQDNKELLKTLVIKISKTYEPSDEDILKIIQKSPIKEGGLLSKSQILNAYRELKTKGDLKFSENQEKNFFKNIRKKKSRTISGVTPITVLTKPFPCPGKCIFCPNDVRMPKSYLADEPGAQRAATNKFDPYYQTFNRLVALRNIGHPTDKAELIVLGGTWTHYPEKYQIWFIKRCFDAMNDFEDYKGAESLKVPAKLPLDTSLLEEIKGESMKKTYNQVITKALAAKAAEAQGETASWEELFVVQKKNEKAKTRCVGLVVETRPDEISEEELIRIRKLGGTKIQIGIQCLDDKVLELNKRGHDVAKTRKAINLIRQAGFKIHAHWMPNLYGSSPKKDIEDFKKLFEDESIKPDELKVYPCSLIESAELMKYYKDGRWKPYSEKELDYVLTEVFKNNKKTNFRQIVEQKLARINVKSKDIRAREIRGKKVEFEDLELKVTEYETKVSSEYFIEYITKKDEIVGFLRLSLPKKPPFLEEIQDSAMIREVHVYGQSVQIGKKGRGRAQHIGLGKNLMKKAEEIAKNEGFKNISVISSIGTREYYEKCGFESIKDKKLYQHKYIN